MQSIIPLLPCPFLLEYPLKRLYEASDVWIDTETVELGIEIAQVVTQNFVNNMI